MSLIYQWSTIANDNGTLGSYPNYWPEGQPPSSVNNCARLMMSSIRTQWNDAQWFNWGYTVARVSGTSFSVITASWNTVTLPAAFETDARIKCLGAGPTTVYGTVTTVSVSAASTLVTFLPDSGSLTSSFSSVFNSIISPTNSSVPSTVGGVTSITSSSLVIVNNSITHMSTVDLPLSVTGNNMVVNGDFQVWQRGAGGSAAIPVAASTTAYTADRWQLQTNANQDCVVSQQGGTTSGSFFATIQRNAGQTGTSPINFLTSLTRSMCVGAAGNKVTLSFYAASSANYSPAASALDIIITTGTGSTDSSALTPWTGTAAQGTTVTLTTSITKFSFTTAVLASNVTQIAATFRMTPVGTAGVADAFIVTDVQLEISPQATAFQRLNFGEQLQNCLPFYEKSFEYSIAPAQGVGLATGEFSFSQLATVGVTQRCNTITYKANKFKYPPNFPTLYNPVSMNGEVRDITLNADCSATAVNIGNSNGFVLSSTAPGGSAPLNTWEIHWAVEAELT